MSRIPQIFESARAEGRKLLMPFMCAGSPRPGLLGEQLAVLERAGASIVEIGIPFSDPIADGPVIAEAMHIALESGVSPGKVFEEVRACREQTSLGLVAMVSVSIVHRMGGPSGFARLAAEAGFDGLIVPDCPFQEAEALTAAGREAGVTVSHLISPSTPSERAGRIAQASSGFVYLLARAGITGERSDAPDIEAPVRAIRESSEVPIACGFGISTAEHVRAVVEHADAAIVGSALVRRMADSQDPIRDLETFTSELVQGLRAE
ncbi:MAG: tryptophan synthase subunit alpha [Planctomycetota bacterium]